MNPFTGGVAWGTKKNSDVLAMEWRYVGLSEVYPTCSGADANWFAIDTFVKEVAARGHQAILRPVIVAPGYGAEDFAPSDLPTHPLWYDRGRYRNPQWDHDDVKSCVLQFIREFAAKYNENRDVAYIQMGLVGLYGEHHLHGARSRRKYDKQRFPSREFQEDMIRAYLNGFGTDSDDLLSSISLDAAQGEGLFAPSGNSLTTSLDDMRFGFFDDTLLMKDHSTGWRSDPAPVLQVRLHKQHGWGGEVNSTCRKSSAWTQHPYDCDQGESLGAQAKRLGLNYMLGDEAFGGDVATDDLLTAAQMLGYKFTATSVTRNGTMIAVTVRNTGVAVCPYKVEVCTGPLQCAGDLSTLRPGASAVVNVPASNSTSQILSLTSPRLCPTSTQKIRWSNKGADADAATLTVTVGED